MSTLVLPFIDANITVNQIIAIFEDIATNHAQINSFAYGQAYDIDAQTIVNPPLLWVWVQPSKMGERTITYVFRAWIMDIVNAEGTGTQQDEVQSDTSSILWDIAVLLRDTYDMQVNFPIDITPFTEAFNSRFSGWFADYTIEVPRQFGACDAPQK